MTDITIYMMSGQTLKVRRGTSLLEILEMCGERGLGVLAAKGNNSLMELTDCLFEDAEVEFLGLETPQGFGVYQRSAALLMLYAAREVLGDSAEITIKHSINKNLYCETGADVTPDTVRRIEEAMHRAVSDDFEVERITVSVGEGRELLRKSGNISALRAIRFLQGGSVSLRGFGGVYDMVYGPVVPSAGYMRHFALVHDQVGFFLQMPRPGSSDKLLELKSLKRIRKVYEESARWAGIMGVDTVGALNEAICAGGWGGIIRVNEALHEKRLASIADNIYNGGKNLVLVAGPSSSGKTTFAKRLCVHLQVLGLAPHIISLDDYFLNREFAPKDEFGAPDLESFDFLDREQLNADLAKLLNGETAEIPRYNFLTGKREYKGDFMKLAQNGVLVLEGIHGLNESLTATVPKELKYKIFISAFTQINIDKHNRVPTSDARLMRRVVRDMRTRGYSAANTLGIWESVTRGEDRNIFPFQEEADEIYNSALVYELCVLKQYIEPLLFGIGEDKPSHAEARRLLTLLGCFVPIPPDDVPNNSILREFIGGSCFNV